MSLNPDDDDDRIAKARAPAIAHPTDDPDSDTKADFAGAMAFGMRAGGQFVGAVVVGGAVGWAIDRWFGTKPFGMLIVMVLCFVAAMANVWLMMTRAVNTATETGRVGSPPAATMERVMDEGDGESS
jgi:F0F1-type ATP synthase assembly protein I